VSRALSLFAFAFGAGSFSACSESAIPAESEINFEQTERGLSCASIPLISFTQYFTDQNGVRRSVLVNYPTARDPAKPSALYIALHGAGGTSASIQQKNVWSCLGKQWVSLYPQGVFQGPPQNNVGWNVTPDGVDQHLMDAIVSWAESTYSIDATKVRAYGFSMGSLMSALLGLTRPGVYGGIGVVCGEIPWTMAMPYPTAPMNMYQTSGGVDATFPPPVSKALHDLVVANDGGLIGTSPGYNADCTFYTVAGGQLIEWCNHPNSGHNWLLNDTLAISDYFTRLGL